MGRRSVVPSRAVLLGAVLLAAGCGGGDGSPSSPSYPAVKGIYGSYIGLPAGASRLRWIAPDGTVTTQDCWAVTSIPTQNGAQFSGSVDRIAPCNSLATFAGTVSTDGSIAFTLAQARWGSCTMTGGGQYTGIVTLGSLVANGRVTVQCDDARAMTVEEQLTGSLPVPPSTAGETREALSAGSAPRASPRTRGARPTRAGAPS